VLIGVAGEIFFDWKEIKPPWALFKKSFAVCLLLALGVEIIEATKSDKEVSGAMLAAGQANEKAANSESNSVRLSLEVEQRSTNLLLQARLQPRRITTIQREKFIESLITGQKGPVIICYGVKDQETLDFAHDLSDMLANAGYPIGPARFIHSWGMRFNPPRPDISIATCIFTNVQIPEYMERIANAFRIIGFTNVTPNMMSIGQFKLSQVATETPMAIFVNGRTY
jgi:hypothetical protein